MVLGDADACIDRRRRRLGSDGPKKKKNRRRNCKYTGACYGARRIRSMYVLHRNDVSRTARSFFVKFAPSLHGVFASVAVTPADGRDHPISLLFIIAPAAILRTYSPRVPKFSPSFVQYASSSERPKLFKTVYPFGVYIYQTPLSRSKLNN